MSGLINKNHFLTDSTCDGLKITLQSTIDLTNYLLNECGFNYVLTAKFNQDNIEVKYNFIIFYTIYNIINIEWINFITNI